MSAGSEMADARRGAAADPMLMECDWKGQVLWMNERVRRAFGSVQNLVETLAAPKTPTPATHRGVSAVCFSRVYQAKEGILLSVGSSAAEFHEIELDNLEGSLLGHYFRLEKAERSLSDRAHRKKRSSGRTAVRQIEMERQRLGRELHTGVGQMLAAIRLQLEVIGSVLIHPPMPVEQALGRIFTLATDALEQVRSISRRLHPPEWQRLTLDAALQQLWEMSGIPERFAASLDLHPLFLEPPPDVKAVLYRAAQEALSNVIRHAHATKVRMSLEARENLLVLTVSDDGIGFDPVRVASAAPSLAAGIGLRSIQDHAASLGGRLTMESHPGETKLTIAVPFAGMG